MFSKGNVRTVILAVAAMALLVAGVVSARVISPDKDLVRPGLRGALHAGTLDEDYNQLRYVKTTDFGATWTDVVQAGDVTTTGDQNTGSFPDFDAVTMANNELCYAIYLTNATTPGIYAVAGPTFAPVLAIPQGSNDFAAVGNSSGWSTIGRTPNGDLFILVWGLNSSGQTTFWGAKSTNNGAAWGTPFVIAAEPTIAAGAAYPQMSQMNSASWVFVLFQDDAYNQYVLRFPTAGGAGTVVNLGVASGSEFSYYTGNVQPIAYDDANNALYVTFRNTDLSGAAVYYSGDQGQTFNAQSVTGGQRYPSMALHVGAQTPFVVSNFGVPAVGAAHQAWYAKDEGGYNGGLWTDPIPFATAPAPYDGTGPLLYQSEMHWWDADRGVASVNLWGAYTPEGVYTSRTTDGGATWVDFGLRWQFQQDTLAAGTPQNCGLTGGTNGVAYVFFSGVYAVSDLEGPVFTNVTLVTPPTQPGPWTLTATVTDANNDTTDLHLSYRLGIGGTEDTVSSNPGFQVTDPTTLSGIATFQIPATHGGTPWATGDSIYFYLWGRDLSANEGHTWDMVLVVGSGFLDVDNPRPDQVTSFALLGNYPNPFNPSTQIVFDLPGAAEVTVRVYNTMGQQVALLADRQAFTQGRHRITFDGANLSTGVYFYTLKAGPYTATQKMLLVK